MDRVSLVKTISDHEYATYSKCRHCNEDHGHHETNDNNNVVKCHKISAYDIMLPKNERKYMAPIRKWEKSMGFITPLRWINIILITSLHVIAVSSFLYVYTTGLYTGNFPGWRTVLYGMHLFL